eukprot:GHRR01033550.1.p1 GENE.GHRR01033550.1~~GHRR01033550.1.p1  ORF type:complete len:101 (+),score=33.77 GHRR01033550.1:457-759(+)
MLVGVVDSGVDGTHPDINYSGGTSWVDGGTAADVDLYGYGTHVAGIMGARNHRQGFVGVAPGVAICSMKVLDGNGKGSLSAVLALVSWAASAKGQAKTYD